MKVSDRFVSSAGVGQAEPCCGEVVKRALPLGDKVPRLALRPEQAAESLGVSRSFFFAQILPELRVVRCGRLRLVPIRSLEDWLARRSSRVVE